MNRDAIDSGRKPVIMSDAHKELVELRRRNRVWEMGIEILKRASAYFARENVLPSRLRLVWELAADGIRVAVARRFLNISTSGYYDWVSRPPSARASRTRN